MYEFYPYITKDASIGLFSPSVDDIYHSSYGAATEAYQKFIFPAGIERLLHKTDEIRVLDICYGIGYNTKSFLNFIFYIKNKKYFSKKYKNHEKILSLYTDTIPTDNIISSKNINNIDTLYTDNNKKQENILSNSTNIDKIYSDNILDKIEEKFQHDNVRKNFFNNKIKIYIKAIDNDKILSFLSPFINSKISENLKIKNNNINFKNEKISKILNGEKSQNSDKKSINKNTPKIPSFLLEYPDAINIALLDSIMVQYPEMILSTELTNILCDKKLNKFFSKYVARYFKLKNKMSIFSNKGDFCSLLHNIYYMYLSRRYKSDLKALKTLDINFELKINDARLEIDSDVFEYDLIFLDAFTPSKCPCLWTVDFFKLLYNHLSSDGIILTYSNSAPVKNAFLNAGFYVGKIYNPIENKFTGTIAAKNKALIKYPLSEFDLGLLKTKAGIFYRDTDLKASNEAILFDRKNEVEKSDLISATLYKKKHPN